MMNKRIDINTIVHNYFTGTSVPKELEEAVSLFKDPYHNLELRPILYEEWNKSETKLPHEIEKEEFYIILNKIHHKINLEQYKNKSPQRRISVVMRIAAVLIIGLLFGFFINEFKDKPVLYCTSIAPKGSISQMILPDNTVVFLNADSKIRYEVNSNKRQREVFLEGEAWFEVTKNEKKPFVVHTPYYDIKVLGTQFNVKAYKTDNEIVTTLERGSVQIISSGNVKICEPKILEPGEQLVYNKLGKFLEIKKVDTRIFTSWKDNKLMFVNMSLKELIVLLERKYGIDIEVQDNIILDYHYDGTIKNETIIEILDMLNETLTIQYKIEGQKIIIQNRN